TGRCSVTPLCTSPPSPLTWRLDDHDQTFDRGGFMTGRFAGKVAVVAGCARPPGIGHATALRLARAGASVVCADAVGDPTAGIEGSYDTGIVTAEVLESVTADVAAAGDGSAVSYRADPFDQSSGQGAADLAMT